MTLHRPPPPVFSPPTTAAALSCAPASRGLHAVVPLLLLLPPPLILRPPPAAALLLPLPCPALLLPLPCLLPGAPASRGPACYGVPAPAAAAAAAHLVPSSCRCPAFHRTHLRAAPLHPVQLLDEVEPAALRAALLLVGQVQREAGQLRQLAGGEQLPKRVVLQDCTRGGGRQQAARLLAKAGGRVAAVAACLGDPGSRSRASTGSLTPPPPRICTGASHCCCRTSGRHSRRRPSPRSSVMISDSGTLMATSPGCRRGFGVVVSVPGVDQSVAGLTRGQRLLAPRVHAPLPASRALSARPSQAPAPTCRASAATTTSTSRPLRLSVRTVTFCGPAPLACGAAGAKQGGSGAGEQGVTKVARHCAVSIEKESGGDGGWRAGPSYSTFPAQPIMCLDQCRRRRRLARREHKQASTRSPRYLQPLKHLAGALCCLRRGWRGMHRDGPLLQAKVAGGAAWGGRPAAAAAGGAKAARGGAPATNSLFAASQLQGPHLGRRGGPWRRASARRSAARLQRAHRPAPQRCGSGAAHGRRHDCGDAARVVQAVSQRLGLPTLACGAHQVLDSDEEARNTPRTGRAQDQAPPPAGCAGGRSSRRVLLIRCCLVLQANVACTCMRLRPCGRLSLEKGGRQVRSNSGGGRVGLGEKRGARGAGSGGAPAGAQ